MEHILVKFAVNGFTEAEVSDGLQYFRDELARRPWLTRTAAWWEQEESSLMAEVVTEGDDPERGALGVLDEVRDCVTASFNFSSEAIYFNRLEARRVPRGT